jgi:hypothetical protein
VDEHELHAERGEQVQVVRQIVEASVGDEVAAESDDEDLPAKSVDVRGDRLEPVDEAILARKPLPARRLRRIRRALVRRRLDLFVRDGVLLLRLCEGALRIAVLRRILCEIGCEEKASEP